MAVKNRVAPYGAWKSPITADLIVAMTVSLAGQIQVQGDDIFWVEGRPAEAGRNVIVRSSAGGPAVDVNPAPFSARSRVHEYGGAPYRVDGDVVYFASFDDNRLYRCATGSTPEPLTPEGPWRYADFVVDHLHGRLIGVREDHGVPGREAENTLIGIDLADGSTQQVLATGNDFYSSPRISRDGRQLAYLTWCHPNMPWDGTELWVADLGDDGSLQDARLVAGGPGDSIFQPEWSVDGDLYFISDRTGWWNPYRLRGDGVECLMAMDAEFGVPQWAFGMSTYDFVYGQSLICVYKSTEGDQLAILDPTTSAMQNVDTPFTSISGVRAEGSRVVFVGGSPTLPPAVVQLDLSSGTITVLRSSSSLSVNMDYVSVPEAIEFPTEGDRTAHAYFYPPHNNDFRGPEGQLPPLIVRSHGGPTGHANTTFNSNLQFWSSRGFAVVDVNYGGSSGFGRAYRERLNGEWGVVDVDDCVNAASYLARQGLVDPNRMVIVGGSAGGYTTLAALTFRDTFTAGASYFGVADLGPLVRDTHKFESRYLFRLVGPYPEREDLYRERSPINFTDRLSCPIILFQGLDDKVVPPNQAQLMAERLNAKGLPYAHVTFAGEGHGFRKAENIKRMLEGELYFYSRIFGFELPEAIVPVRIENFP